MFKPRSIEIRDDYDRRAEQERRRRGRKSYRARAGDEYCRAGGYASGDASVIAGRQSIAKAGKVSDFGERLVLVRKLEQVPISVRHHHVFGLSSDPTAEIDVAVGATCAARVHVEANVGAALLAVAATSARNVERHRDQVALADEFNPTSAFDDFAGNLMPEDQSRRRRGAPADHMLVAAA